MQSEQDIQYPLLTGLKSFITFIFRKSSTEEHPYNEDLAVMRMSLLYHVFCYMKVKKREI